MNSTNMCEHSPIHMCGYILGTHWISDFITNILRIAINILVLKTMQYIHVVFGISYIAVNIISCGLSLPINLYSWKIFFSISVWSMVLKPMATALELVFEIFLLHFWHECVWRHWWGGRCKTIVMQWKCKSILPTYSVLGFRRNCALGESQQELFLLDNRMVWDK